MMFCVQKCRFLVPRSPFSLTSTIFCPFRFCSTTHRISKAFKVRVSDKSAISQDLNLSDEALADLPKNFDPLQSEERIYQWWEENGCFQPDLSAEDCFVISMPPPNVTGRLHMGHAMFVTLQDIMIRFARMNGKSTLWVPGTDHAGIATQMVVEKMLRETESIDRITLGREKFEERIWKWKSEYGGFITQQLRRLGASCDWSRERFTLDNHNSMAVCEAFVQLHAKGLIYKGSYLVNWSPTLQTAVSDLEVEYSEEQGTLYFFKYPLASSKENEFIPVATTRPETILGDTAVAVHPADDRYRHLIGQKCLVPMMDREITIVGDEYVDREFGTGALKITPGHDPNDYEIGQRLNLETINIMNKDGSLNQNAGKYAGLDRFQARKQLWSDMELAGLVIRQEKYKTRVPRSQRGGEIIEPMISEQWFVKMDQLAQNALQAVNSGQIEISPNHFTQVFNNWLENIKDWCISRQLWWGHRIPVWYPKPSSVSIELTKSDYIVAQNYEEALNLAKERYGSEVQIIQDNDVLDTWFSSGLWPFSVLGWPDESSHDFQKFYPTQILETGHDILFFWVARMIMMGLEFTGKPPFSLVFLHGLVRDDQGRKMSKSLGNVVDPLDLVSKYGADPLRYTMVTGITAGQDLNLNLEKFTSSRHFTNKIWNIGKFIGMNLPAEPSQQTALAEVSFSETESMKHFPMMEKWILSRLHQTIDRVSELLDRYDLSEAGRELYQFIWFDFADWYVEGAKTRFSDSAPPILTTQCQQVLVYCYDKILKMIHPFMPFISERLWQALPHNGHTLIQAPWPKTNSYQDDLSLQQFMIIQSIIKAVRNARAEYNVDQSRRITGTIIIPREQLLEALKLEKDVVVLLAKMDENEVHFALTAPLQSEEIITLVAGNGIEVILPMSGMYDPIKELERLQKQKTKIEKELSGLNTRLQNENFISKAPRNIISEVQEKQNEAKTKLQQLNEKLLLLSAK